jgi:hypothetical protein
MTFFGAGLAAVVLLVSTVPATAAVRARYNRHPAAPLTFGIGFSPDDITTGRQDCFTFVQATEDAIEKQQISITYVESAFDESRAEGLDVGVSARTLAFSASATLSKQMHASKSGETTTLVVRADGLFRVRRANDLKLKPQFAELIRNNKHAEFERACGSRLVNREASGAKLFLILTINRSSKSEVNQLKASLQASGGVPGLSASVKTSFNKMVATAQKEKRLTLSVSSEGVDTSGLAVAAFDAALKDNDPFEQLKLELQKALKPPKDNMVPIYFDSLDMEQFGWKPPKAPLNEDALVQLAARVSRVDERILAGEQILELLPTPFADDRRKPVADQVEALEREREKLVAAHQKCLERPDCAVPPENNLVLRARSVDLPLTLANWVRPPIAPSMAQIRIRKGDYLVIAMDSFACSPPRVGPVKNHCKPFGLMDRWEPYVGPTPTAMSLAADGTYLEFVRLEGSSATPRSIPCKLTKLPHKVLDRSIVVRLDNACGQFTGPATDPVQLWVRELGAMPEMTTMVGFQCTKPPYQQPTQAKVRPPFGFTGQLSAVGDAVETIE